MINIKIKLLGTAAAEGWPGLFCNCEACKKAIKQGGKNIRKRSSCLIEKKFLIDFPSDIYGHVIQHNLNLSEIEYLLVTHSHLDHFYPDELVLRNSPYAHNNSDKPLKIFGNTQVKEKLRKIISEDDESIQFENLIPESKFKIKNIEVIPILADHGGEDEDCFLFIIINKGKTILYGHDSGYFPEESWRIIKEFKFDCVILDCTGGPLDIRKNHMGISTNVEVKKRLMNTGAATNNTMFILTHFSHNGKLLHDELVKKTKKYNFRIAYDGLQVEV